jgi:sulfite exporter TauE/SafE
MFAAGLASGLHCAGMCGGIVTAFSARRVIPIAPAPPARPRLLAFNAGRITTYSLAGALAGVLGAGAYAAAAVPAQEALYVILSALLVLIGLHLTGWRPLSRLEALAMPLWRRVQPLAARLAAGNAYVAGLAWGCLPCAMVYAALFAAAAAGDPLRGAVAMAVFGLGTLPLLLAAGWLAARIAAWRRVAGALLLGFGFYGLAHAGALGDGIRRGLLCF